MSAKKKTATVRSSKLKDLGAKKNPKGGESFKLTTGTRSLNPQPLPP